MNELIRWRGSFVVLLVALVSVSMNSVGAMPTLAEEREEGAERFDVVQHEVPGNRTSDGRCVHSFPRLDGFADGTAELIIPGEPEFDRDQDVLREFGSDDGYRSLHASATSIDDEACLQTIESWIERSPPEDDIEDAAEDEQDARPAGESRGQPNAGSGSPPGPLRAFQTMRVCKSDGLIRSQRI